MGHIKSTTTQHYLTDAARLTKSDVYAVSASLDPETAKVGHRITAAVWDMRRTVSLTIRTCGSAADLFELFSRDDGALFPFVFEQLDQTFGGVFSVADGRDGCGDVGEEPVGEGGEGVWAGAAISPGQAAVVGQWCWVECAVLGADPDLRFQNDFR